MQTKPIAIMFSGGADSLSLLSMAATGTLKGIEPPTEIHLMYMLNGMSRFPSFPRERVRVARELLTAQYGRKKKLPDIIYSERDSARLFQALWVDHYEELMPRYNGKNLVCVACKAAMHTRSILYCLENNIQQFITGYTKKQHYYPEQTPAFMDRLREFSHDFGVETLYPIFNEFNDEVTVRHYLEDHGLPSAAGGEMDCMFSQTYTTAKEEDTANYLDDILPLVGEYIEAELDGDFKKAAGIFPPGRVKGKLMKMKL